MSASRIQALEREYEPERVDVEDREMGTCCHTWSSIYWGPSPAE
jgi:hypothetical protein